MFWHVLLVVIGVWLILDDHPIIGVILILAGCGVIP